MKIHNFETILNFGKHKSKSIKSLIEENEYSYLFWCLKNHESFCFSENLFNVIKGKEIRKAILEDFVEDNGNISKNEIIEEKYWLELEILNLKKNLKYYQKITE